jgi:hypothetical protein
MEINEALSKCFKKKIKVYPEIKGSEYRVVINITGNETIGKKTFSQKTIVKAIENTYLYLA